MMELLCTDTSIATSIVMNGDSSDTVRDDDVDDDVDDDADLHSDDDQCLHCPVCSRLYSEPRVLPCLHVCCTPCIERLLASTSEDEFGGGVIECPVCKQRAGLPDGGNVSCLPIDVVMLNARDSLDVRQRQVMCTSCHANQTAVARCADCASFLCAICVNAHQYMHCFKNHKLTAFDDLLNSGSSLVDFHKPMFCSLHTSESLEYFCFSCQIPLCRSCTTCQTHRVHHCERIVDVETAQFAELFTLVNEVKQAKSSCEDNLSGLQTSLETLREQRDAARKLIEQTTADHLSLLEKTKDEMLDKLNELHADARQTASDRHKAVGTKSKQLADACCFTERILQKGKGAEIASLKPIVMQRLLGLHRELSHLSNSVASTANQQLEFVPEMEKFTEAVGTTFGRFGKPDEEKSVPNGSNPIPDAPGNGFPAPTVDPIARKLSALYQAQHHGGHGMSASPDALALQGRSGSVASDGLQGGRSIVANGNPVRSSSVTFDDRLKNSCWSSDDVFRTALNHTRGQSVIEENSLAAGQLWSPDASMWKMNNDCFAPSFSSVPSNKPPSRGPTSCFDSSEITHGANATSQLGLAGLGSGLNNSPQLVPGLNISQLLPGSTNFFDTAVSHNSTSPTSLSDSGISLDAASNGSGVRSAAAIAAAGSISAPGSDLVNLSNLTRFLAPSPVNHHVAMTSASVGSSWMMPGGLDNNNTPGLSSLLSSSHVSDTSSLPDSVLSELLSSLNSNSSSLTSSDISHLLASLSTTPTVGSQSPDFMSSRPVLSAGRPADSFSSRSSSTGYPSDSTLNGLLEQLLASNAPNVRSCTTPTLGNFLPTSDSTEVSIKSNLIRTSKLPQMHLRCRIGEPGVSLGQMSSPHGFCLGIDEDIVVADTLNHRIQIFNKDGEMKNIFGTAGRDDGQLWHPRKVAFSRLTQHYIVCDRGSERSRLQLFTQSGQFIRKISIRYIDIVAGLTVDAIGNIVAVDSVKPTVFCITERGELLRWFDCSNYMCEPSDIAVLGSEYFVCDFKGHCIVVFTETGQYVRHIGDQSITTFPSGIDTSDAGDILVGDSHGNRFHLAVFQRDGSLVSEFECPYIKVSRCCGLRVTAEGYVVTLSKNNQHVLVFNTLYIA